jgi:hypothetical protein
MLFDWVVQVLAGSLASSVAIVVSLVSVNGQELIDMALAQLSFEGATVTELGGDPDFPFSFTFASL